MKSLINKLHHICTQFPIKEKIVIVDSYAIGEQINEAFLKEGKQAINLRYKTVEELAGSIVELNTDQPLNSLDDSVGVQVTYSLLKNLREQDKLFYFAVMEITPSFSHAIYNTIQILRLAGYTNDILNKDAFITKEKAEDLATILNGYENILAVNQFTDKAALLIKALEFAKKDEAVYILQSGLHLSYLEDQLLQKVLPQERYFLPLAPVFGVNTPEGFQISWGDPTPFSYLYQLEDGVEVSNLSIFTAKTEELEVKQILEHLKATNAPLDESVVYYTNAEDYIALFFQLSQKMDLPVTYGEGAPIAFSRPGRLVAGLLAWIQSNYSVQNFLDIVNEGLVDLGDGAPSRAKISHLLRDIQIGWSQDHYLSKLQNEIKRLEDQRSLSDDKQYYENRMKEVAWLQQWFSLIFKKLPSFSGIMNYKNCLAGMAHIIKNHCKTSSAMDEMAKVRLLDEIDKILPYADETLTSYDVLEKLKDLLLSIRVNQSRPRPGHLHVSSYKSSIYNCRSNVFFVGLDNRKFPGNTSEDPLLLDTERMHIGHNLPLLQHKGQENLYILLQALAQSSGRTTVSYCHFNINDNRVVNPSFVVLQCYRLLKGNKDAVFKELGTMASSIIPHDIFEEKDFWNVQLTQNQPAKISEGILNQFQNIKWGIAAETARHSEAFSEYEGLIQIDANLFDPRINQEKTMSAGKLEMLAKCPYSYFLKEVLLIKPIEEIAFDANKWLDPATRGSLLHRIFEHFYKQLKQENAKPSVPMHMDKLKSLAIQLIDQQKELLPPPNDRVYLREVNDILACCEIFLKEEELHGETVPLHFEYSFGIGEAEPAIITLPSGEVNISGIIDRVDQSENGSYHIIDYKTGSAYGYAKKGAFKGGRQLQHLIYALAIEQHLNLGAGAVAESTYYFPTVKGMAERFTRKQDPDMRTNGLILLENLIEIIKHGHFLMTDDENDCKYCDFKLVCRRHFYGKETLEMKQSNQRLKGIRAYD